MKKHLFGMALLTCLVFVGGVASAQTTDIGDIQVYDINGVDASPYDGQVVTVQGYVYVDAGMYNSGTHYIQDATGGLQIYASNWTGDYDVELGDLITVQGTVDAYHQEIQLTSSPTVISNDPGTVPDPITVAMADLGYDWVGNFIAVVGDVTEVNANSQGGDFTITDGTNTLFIYCDYDTGIDLNSMVVGETYEVRGPLNNWDGSLQMKPRMQADLVSDPGAPVILGYTLDNYVPDNSDPITVTAEMTDDVAITTATLYYRDSDGVAPGAWGSTVMTAQGGDLFAGTIPAPHTMTSVDFYLSADDGVSDVVYSPVSAPAGFFSIATGFTPIYDVQYVHPDSSSQDSALLGQAVNIRGIVTAEPGQTGGSLSMIVQELEPSDDWDTYGFGGVVAFHLGGIQEIYRGDTVKVGGLVEEYYGVTEVVAQSADAIVLDGFGDALPPASKNYTATLADRTFDDGDGFKGEEWESVWVSTYVAAVVDTNGSAAYGQFAIQDRPVPSLGDTLWVESTTDLSYSPLPGDMLKLEGYMTVYSGYRLAVISDEFIINTGATPVDDTPALTAAGGFHSIFPNPFNPATKVKFVVGRDNLVQLNIYNIRGEKVRTLVEDRLSANTYEMIWDGTNDSGSTLPSGNYFARLRVGNELTQVRKMALIK